MRIALAMFGLMVVGNVALFIVQQVAKDNFSLTSALKGQDIASLKWLALFLWAAVSEEIIVRGWLRNAQVALGCILLVSYFNVQVLKSPMSGLYYVLMVVCVLGLLRGNSRAADMQQAGQLLDRLLPVTFYASSILFAFMHIANWSGAGFGDPAALLVVLPQLFGGLVLGYVRVVCGLGGSIAVHAGFNASVWALAVMLDKVWPS